MRRRLLTASVGVVPVIGVLALVLAFAPDATARGATRPRASSASVPTRSLDPSSICGDGYDFVQQSTNGDIAGCFRIPNLHSSSLVVALQTYIDQGEAAHSGPTTLPPSNPAGHESLSVGAAHVTPGERVTVTGQYITAPPQPRTTMANLCWDGCQTGLQESVQLHWVSPSTFRTTLAVPDTAWLVTAGGTVSIHPLQTGSYEVGIECLGLVSGCALGPADAQTSVQLRVAGVQRCEKGQSCESLHLSAVASAVGDEVQVTGWAPLQTIIGGPFGYNLSVAATPGAHHWPLMTSTLAAKSGGYDVVLAPTILHLEASPAWASLGRLHPLSSTWAGPSIIDEPAGSARVGWCLATGLTITDGSLRHRVPTAGVARALSGTAFRALVSSKSVAECAGVLLDPGHAGSVFGEFDAEIGNSIPPVYLAGLYSTDGGASWRTVPTPPGESLQDFAGFVSQGHRVEALFASATSYDNRSAPSGTTRGLVRTEDTTDGGATWTANTLGCPPSGPCTMFGPFYLGHCAMNPSPQALLVGPAGTTASSGVRWKSSSWVTTVDSCVSPELVVTSSRDLVLLDATSQYPLLRSTNAGAAWTSVALPPIPVNYGPDSIPWSNSLLLGADGSLFESVTTPSGHGQMLWRLDSGASSWCQVPGVFGPPSAYRGIGPLRTHGSDLMWTQTDYPNDRPETSSTHVVALSTLHC